MIAIAIDSPSRCRREGPGGRGGYIGKWTHTNTIQSLNILDIVLITNRVYMRAQDKHRPCLCICLMFVKIGKSHTYRQIVTKASI